MAADLDPNTDAFWAAVEDYSQSDGSRAGAGAKRKRVEEAARELLSLPSDTLVYSSKLTSASVNNQVWQGKSISSPNELMVFDAWDIDRAEVAVRKRLAPLQASGFEAVVLGRMAGAAPLEGRPGDSDRWEVYHVVEYHHSDVGERLNQLLNAEFPVTKIADPAMGAIVTEEALIPGDLSIDPERITSAEVALHLNEFPNVVLEGPPGTGKTWLAFQVANLIAGQDAAPFRLESILGGRSINDALGDIIQAPLVWEIVQFHPGFGYEEFVRGLRTDPEADSFSLVSVDGVLPKISQVAALRQGKPTLLIIDEINRSNLSAVLGETIFAIDPAHRGEKVRLQLPAPPRGVDELVVPKNLLILATMNTADRSLAMLDFAVRRRFRFLRADPSVAELEEYYASSPARSKCAGALLRAFISAVDDVDLAPGHSYFMLDAAGELSDEQWLLRMIDKLVHDVRPLFDEYKVEGLSLRAALVDDIDMLIASTEQMTQTLLQWFGQTGDEP